MNSLKIYGDKIKGKSPRSEEAEQKEFAGWLKEHRPLLWRVMLHPQNEGRRTHAQIAKARSLGALTTGASDVIIPALLPFVCELKAVGAGTKISKGQKEYIESVEMLGAFGCIAYGCDGAKKALIE